MTAVGLVELLDLVQRGRAGAALAATNWTLEFLMVFQNCLACGSVIDASLVSRVNDFPSELPTSGDRSSATAAGHPRPCDSLARMETTAIPRSGHRSS